MAKIEHKSGKQMCTVGFEVSNCGDNTIECAVFNCGCCGESDIICDVTRFYTVRRKEKPQKQLISARSVA